MRNMYSSSRAATLVGVFLVLSIVVSSLALVWIARRQAIEEWRAQLSNLSLILAEQTSQEVTSASLVLDSIVENVMAANIKTADELREKMAGAEDFKSMRDKTRGLPQIDVATIVAANGDVINFTRSFPAPRINLSDRDYFKAQSGDPTLGLFISKPVRNKGNNGWTFYLSRRLNGPNGEFLGLVIVGLSSSFFSDFYEKISLGDEASITLYRRDFTLLARWPHVDNLMGKANLTGSSYSVIEESGKTDDVVVTSAPRFSQNGETLYRMGAPRMVSKYPLIVNITVTDQLFLAQWHRYAHITTIIAGGSMLAIVLAFALLVKSLKRRERDMAAAELLKLEAQKANRAKSEFLAMMSHEIRTPLTAIIGFAQLMGDSPDAGERSQAGEVISRNGQHLLSIINNILDLSKVEAGQLSLESIAFSPLDILRDVESMMKAQARSKGIMLSTVIKYPIPGEVIGDPTRWKQIVFNLCSNAIKFTEFGSVQIRLCYDRAQSVLTCSVADTGIGMSQQQLQLLFKPFSQADSAIARKYGGTGLGLHLAQELAGRMNGRISVTSEAGQGSVFVFTASCPVAETSSWIESGLFSTPSGALAAVPGESSSLEGRILVAEDGVDNQRLIEAFLIRCGLAVVFAENGEQAVSKALEEHFDLVLMDMQMPVMDGIAATEILRGAGFGSPIVALTANVMPDDVERFLQAGCNCCVGKPIDFNELTRVLGELLGKGAGQVAFDVTATAEFDTIKQDFVRSLPERFKQLEAAVAAHDWPAAGRIAHSLKGTGGSFGFPQVTDLARKLELAFANADAERIAHIHDALAQLQTLLPVQDNAALAETAPI